MNNKTIISKSIVTTSVLILVCFLLLISYVGYQLPTDIPFASLMKEVILYNEEGNIIRTISPNELEKIKTADPSRVRVVLDFSNIRNSQIDYSLYITPVLNPIRVLKGDTQVLEIGDFKNKKIQVEIDYSIDLELLKGQSVVYFDLEKNLTKGVEFDFLFKSGIAKKSQIQMMKLARSFLTVQGYLSLSVIFLIFFIVTIVIGINTNLYKNFGFLGISFLGQSWMSFYFSCVWIQTSFVELVNISSFGIYFFTMGSLLIAYLGRMREISSIKKIHLYLLQFSIFSYFASGLIILSIKPFYKLAVIVTVYKILLTITLIGLFISLVIYGISKGFEKRDQEWFTSVLALTIIVLGQTNDILRVYSKTVFMYNIGPYAFFLGSLIFIANAINIIQRRFILSLQYEKLSAVYELSQQVSHDIRSPVAALNLILSDLDQMPEQKRIIARSAIQRINDIANSLLEKSKRSYVSSKETTMVSTKDSKADRHSDSMKTQPVLLSSVVESLLSEKRIQLREHSNIQLEQDFSGSYGSFSLVNPQEFQRLLSNIINNSVEAFIEGKGAINVQLHKDNKYIQLTIADTGRGIPENIINMLGERGFSYGKETSQNSGSGLGIYHAKKTIESWNGIFSIQSQINVGTKIQISLPICQTPSWFVEELILVPGSILYSVDDDQSIHGIWGQRCSTKKFQDSNIQLKSMTSAKEFIKEVKTYSFQHLDQMIFLIDFEFLNQNINGLELIESLQLQKYSYLVTSRYEDSEIIKKCNILGVKLIPKSLAGVVPIIIKENKS